MNMFEVESVTLKEAQYLLGRSEEEINRAIDRDKVGRLIDVISAATTTKQTTGRPKGRAGAIGRRRSVAKRKVRKLGAPELLYLAVEAKAHSHLTPAGRKKLYAAIKAQAPGASAVVVGPFHVPLERTAKELESRYRELKALRAGIVENERGDPHVKGTNVSLYVLAALAEGQRMEEILEDYPSLNEEQVRRAIDYARAYPKKGRPYPKRSFKRMAAALATSGALDLPSDAGARSLSPSDFE
jgi:uncharacterized protein (DUF433 family)